MQYAHSTIHFKAIDAEARIIEGIASTPTPDRAGDSMDPSGAQFTLPMPFLWQHQQDKPIGWVTDAQVTDAGIRIRAQLAKGVLPFIDDEVWPLLKSGLVPGLSIGWLPMEGKRTEKGYRIAKWGWYETSAVTIPLNQETTITAIKSADALSLAASGRGARVPFSAAGVPAQRKDAAMNVSEQLTARKAELRIKTERLEALINQDTLDQADLEERDTVTGEVKALTGDVNRLSTLEQALVARRSEFAVVPAARLEPTLAVKAAEPTLPPGIAFTRLIMCQMGAALGVQRGEFKSAIEIARERFPHDSRLTLALKAAVAPATTTDATWAAPLVYAETVADFVNYLRPRTIIGQFGQNGVPSLRAVPFNSRTISQTSGGAGWWVGQAKPKPVTKFDYAAATLGPAKVAALTVLAEELMRFGNHPSVSAESAARDGLTEALSYVLDVTFIDPSVAAVAGVSPASITNGVTPIASSGTDLAAIYADLNALIAEFVTDNMDPRGLVLIMPATLALAASFVTNGIGEPAFPGLSMNGGRLGPVPVIVSETAAATGDGNLVIAVNAPEIYLADDGGVSIDLSREASVEMDNAPTQAPPAGAALVSLWQNNLVGLRAERFINWAKRRATAVAFMANVDWGAPAAGGGAAARRKARDERKTADHDRGRGSIGEGASPGGFIPPPVRRKPDVA